MNPTKYVCPFCGQNNVINEISLAYVRYRGQLDDNGLVTMFDTETPIIEDNPNDPLTNYECEDCGGEFQDPITLEEYEEHTHED